MLNEALRIAVGDLLGNVASYRVGLLAEPAPVIFAGPHYYMPCTRDTPRSILVNDYGGNTQYWDVIV